MSLFEDASLIVTPNAVKAGKLYSIKPTDGSGDLDVVRATTATRVNESGLIESVANNVPRLDYLNGSCPSILVEPQRTNLYTYNNADNVANWLTNMVSTTSEVEIVESPIGEMRAIGVKPSTSSRRFERVFLADSLEPDETYVFSWYRKRILAPEDPNVGDLSFISPVNILYTSSKIQIESPFDDYERFQITFEVIDETELSRLRGYFGAVNGIDGVIRLAYWGLQIEKGEEASSHIPTEASTVTRNADVISITGLTGITTITETFENETTNIISGSPTSYTMSQGRIKQVIGI